jgi:hypothetical protein
MKSIRKFFCLFAVVSLVFMLLLGEVVFALDKDYKSNQALPDKTDIDKKTIKHKQDKKPVDIVPADKADLVIEKIEVFTPRWSERIREGETLVDNCIRVHIKNRGIETSSSLNEQGTAAHAGSAFMIRWEVLNDTPGGLASPIKTNYTKIWEGMFPGAGEAYHVCEESVLRDSSRTYRVTVDSSNWVDEFNERNNVRTITHNSTVNTETPF